MRETGEHILFIICVLLMLFLSFNSTLVFSQSDECSTATALSLSNTCYLVSGTTVGKTASAGAPVCVGTEDDDVWYKFTTGSSCDSVFVSVTTTDPNFDPVLQILSGTCAGLASINCTNASGTGGNEATTLSDLSLSTTYYIRVFGFGSGDATKGAFSICAYSLCPPVNDTCTGATTLSLGSSCYSTSGSTYNATYTGGVPACTGNDDDDVWYKFTTNASCDSVSIAVTPSNGNFDAVFQVLSGTCGSQSSVSCKNDGGPGVKEQVTLSGLSLSTTYYVRVYGNGSGDATKGPFTICAYNLCPPANDNCSGAPTLSLNSSCVSTSGYTYNATQSGGVPACTGDDDDDVWYKFTTSAICDSVSVAVTPSNANFDAVFQVLSGTCGSQSSVICKNDNGVGVKEQVTLSGLGFNTTYYVRVYGNGSGDATKGPFSVCAYNLCPPANDDCAGATSIAVNSTCSFTSGNTFNATTSGGAPACLGNNDDDVWFKFTTDSATTAVGVKISPNSSFDAVLQIFSGTCGSLDSVSCVNQSGTGGTENVSISSLTTNTTYFIRVYSFGSGDAAKGSFSICVNNISPPLNDNCSGAISVPLSSSTCTSTNGNTKNATASGGVPACMGNPDDDVWYKFTTAAGSNYAFIYVEPASSGFDPVFQVLSGACGGQSSLSCVNSNAAGLGETTGLTGLTGSTTYYTRVFSAGTGSGTEGSFTVCVFNGSPPANDNCASAINLSQGATCSPTAGTSAWATNSGVAACSGIADDDVWYKFTTGAGITYEHIIVDPDNDMDAVVQVFSGACGGLSPLVCQNSVGSGGTEDFFISGLTGSTQYFVRVYHSGNWYGNAPNSGTFTICIQGGSPPSNDNCASAINLPSNGSCVTTNGSTTFATPSGTGTPCPGGSVDDDVWYSFTSINFTHTLTIDPNSAMNVQVQILEGACGSLITKQCQDNVGIDGTEIITVSNLSIGGVYYIRINHNGIYYGSNGTFSICNVANSPTGGDGLCNPISLPTVTSACTYGTFDNSAMPTGSSELPAGCGERANGLRRQMWFKFIVPSIDRISINVKGLSGNMTDPTVAAFLWDGSGCLTTDFSLISCNDDFCNVNGDCNYHSVLNLSGRTPGETIFLKVSSATTDNGAGTFKLCVTAPINDNCTSPLFACDLTNFQGTTSAGYTVDNGGLQGSSGGPFGSPGVTTIENNSWVKFEASATSSNITIIISDCYLDDGGAGGNSTQTDPLIPRQIDPLKLIA